MERRLTEISCLTRSACIDFLFTIQRSHPFTHFTTEHCISSITTYNLLWSHEKYFVLRTWPLPYIDRLPSNYMNEALSKTHVVCKVPHLCPTFGAEAIFANSQPYCWHSHPDCRWLPFESFDRNSEHPTASSRQSSSVLSLAKLMIVRSSLQDSLTILM